MKRKTAILFAVCAWSLSVCAQPPGSIPVELFSAGSFEQATHIFAGKQGSIYILDADLNKIFFFTNITQTPKSIGGFGWSAGSFDKPTGIATDGINVYVSDYGNHRIQRFDRYLNYISSFSTRDTMDQTAMRFGFPLDVAISDLGDLFVLDGENLRVIKFNPQQFFERSFGDINAGKGKLQNPVRLIVTTSQILVGERTRIVVFDYFGNYIRSVGEGIVSALSGFTLLETGFFVASNDTLLQFSQEGILQKSIPVNHLITGEPIERIQDIAYINNKLFILSPRRVHVFKITE
jgi:DNA-binding beta-propeller fold protein YncE